MSQMLYFDNDIFQNGRVPELTSTIVKPKERHEAGLQCCRKYLRLAQLHNVHRDLD